jgi:glycosyltransferase involved in cell wall biosynthesis
MPDRSPEPLSVLVIAEACNPTWTSVPLVGYNFARALAERPDLKVTLVSQVRNRAALKADRIASLAELHFIDNEWLAAPMYAVSRFLRGGTALAWTIDTAMAWPSYMVFEHELHRQLGRQIRAGKFALIHRVTPLTPTMGSPLAALVDVPMLIGPLNGGLPWPKEFPELRRQEREWLVPLRNAYKHLPYYRQTYCHLAGVIAGSRHTATEVPRSAPARRFYLPENGVDPTRFPLASAWPEPHNRFRFLTIGRLVPYKGVDLTLEAMHRSALLKQCEFVVLGDGPQRAHLEALTRQYGLEGSVRFLGWVDQVTLGKEMASAQAFVFPSLREFGGGVVLEALASALPAIIVDYGGPAELVTPECGILLRMQPREALVQDLQAAMEALAVDPERCRRLGRAACQRVRDEFTWTSKAARIVEMYRQLVTRGASADTTS